MRSRRWLPAVLSLLGLLSCRRHEESDVEVQIAQVGLDYGLLRRRAERHPKALPDYFDLWRYTDGGGSEDYASDLSKLLERCGESPFLIALESSPQETRDSILGLLAYDKGLERAGPDWSLFCERFPALSGRAAAVAR